ncbi:hypothetical protein [Phycicoccus sonneratiae]|uniref:Uncharacterized protein n=1 Tax=Phycicoccus sonneratiae TaxID=2807628 RepID=A0ABS2CMA1_9MICO|nr:hypothetical protein [Phycicoccus sonneraticus]MBM6400588.1 hypothetical protein [Phycicoccus sonneraticus]
MQRFPWAPWGLLLVVLDLRIGSGVALWDVLPDVVGYVWLVVALTGAQGVARGFVLARSAALVGVPVSLVTGTPLQSVGQPLLVAALVVQAVVFAGVLYGLVTGVQEAAAGHPDVQRWGPRLRVAALVVGVLLLLADPSIFLVTSDSPLAAPVTLLWLAARLAEAVVGVLTVVMVFRVARAGALTTA